MNNEFARDAQISRIPRTPSVLCLSGHDPTGGAGLQADTEAIAAQGAHAVSVITAQTIQNTDNVLAIHSTDAQWLNQAIESLMADCDIRCVKIGLIGSVEQVPVIARRLRQLKVPVVLDPVLRAGGGAELSSPSLQTLLLEQLLPLTSVFTPNAAEARRLVPGIQDLSSCAESLLQYGCDYVLITGGDEPGAVVTNTLYASAAAPVRFEWPRLAETFHGAGCTLASAIAAQLALGQTGGAAVDRAQTYTQHSLARALRVGQGRRIPGRVQHRA